jgi:hypothetical protein
MYNPLLLVGAGYVAHNKWDSIWVWQKGYNCSGFVRLTFTGILKEGNSFLKYVFRQRHGLLDIFITDIYNKGSSPSGIGDLSPITEGEEPIGLYRIAKICWGHL